MNPHRLAPALALALALPAVSLAATPASKGPRLAVILVVDQLGYQTMRAMRHHFGKTGIERLTSEGASFTQAVPGSSRGLRPTPPAAVAVGVVGVAVAMTVGVVAAASYAEKEGVRYAQLLAARDAFAGRVAFEVAGPSSRSELEDRRREWRRLRDTSVQQSVSAA